MPPRALLTSVVIALLMQPICCGVDLDRTKLTKQLVKHEGRSKKAYADTAGNLTIGVGFNLNRGDAKAKIEGLGLDFVKVKAGSQELTEEQITKLLDGDIETAITDAKSIFDSFSELSDVRQRVIVDMIFNLGKPKFQGFMKMINAVKTKDFNKAADEMKDSKWYSQVGERGKTLESMMRSGLDP